MEKHGLTCAIDFNEEINSEATHSNDSRANRALWRAVITQALIDASSNSKKKNLQFAKRQALKWLRERSQDFFLVCNLAEMDPEYVICRSRKALSRGCRWRKDKKSANPILLFQNE